MTDDLFTDFMKKSVSRLVNYLVIPGWSQINLKVISKGSEYYIPEYIPKKLL